MKAFEALGGQMYRLEKRVGRPNVDAECIGWNFSHECILFLVFDEWAKRRVLNINPNEIVEPLN